MKFVTFNIRYDTPRDGVNAFTHRKGAILEKIESEKPDVVCFQECRPHVFDFLRKYLTDYEIVGCGRGADYEDEHVPTAFLKDKYELISLDTQWLSPTPYVPGSRYECQSPCPRTITRATLREYGRAKPFHVFGAHLDHQSDEARVLGAKRTLEVIKEALKNRDFPLVLAGDFNAYPGSAPINALLGDAELCLADHTRNIGHSYHGYGTSVQPRIDYIMSRGFIETREAAPWTECADGIYLSDHYPIAVELEAEDAI